MSRDTRHRDLPAPVRRLAFFRSLLEPILLEPILLEPILLEPILLEPILLEPIPLESTIPMPCL